MIRFHTRRLEIVWRGEDGSRTNALAELGYCSQLIHDTPHLVNGGHNSDSPFDAWMPVRGAEVDRPWITDSWEPLSNWRFDPLFDFIPLEMERRGSDPALADWLRSRGQSDFPESFRSTDATPAWKGWKGGYWSNMFFHGLRGCRRHTRDGPQNDACLCSW